MVLQIPLSTLLIKCFFLEKGDIKYMKKAVLLILAVIVGAYIIFDKIKLIKLNFLNSFPNYVS